MNDPQNRNPEPLTEPAGALPEKKARSVSEVLFDYVEMFAWAVFIVIVLFTFGFRICQVEGPSMEDTLQQGQRLLLRSAFYTPKQDDIIVFHMTKPEAGMEKTLVKRVIAVGGQEVVIDTNAKTITVDGVEYADAHRYFELKDPRTPELGEVDYDLFPPQFTNGEFISTGIFKTTVPEGCVFVMGDNRNHSNDSRGTSVGFVDQNCILGKVVFRFSPFTFF